MKAGLKQNSEEKYVKVIGLTGGIASGKSTASKVLEDLNIKIIDADVIAREIVKAGKPALKEIKEAFGHSVIDEFGELKRSELAKIVFNNKEKLEILNQITHKPIIEQIELQIKSYKELKSEKVIILDAALLIELKLNYLVDEIWLIVVDKKTQVERLVAREHMTKDDALKIIDAQMQLEEKKKYADVLIDNTGSINFMKEKLVMHINRVMEEFEHETKATSEN